MSGDFLDDRRRALEEAFFAKHNEALRQKLGQKDAATTGRDALAAASGISDPVVLDKLGSLNIGAEALTALTIVPLVLVAWADGGVDDKERAAILAAASEAGVDQAGPGHALLGSWLSQRPPEELFTAWKAYIGAVSGSLDGGARQALRAKLLDRARGVAETTGGMLGLGRKVSAAEDAVLRQLDAALA